MQTKSTSYRWLNQTTGFAGYPTYDRQAAQAPAWFDYKHGDQAIALEDTPDYAATPLARPAAEPAAMRINAKQLYWDLNKPVLVDTGIGEQIKTKVQTAAEQYLRQQLAAVGALDSDLPADLEGIANWIDQNNDAVGRQYREYLQARRAGAPRLYFTTKSHALYFLQSVAPTKLVDGAWLYGFVQQWRDPRFAALTKIYLEELGDGMVSKNHVVLYKKLLSDNECDRWQDLPENYFIQGATQLALGQNVEQFMPEVIGYNLGYEQLPLHLLITAYELNELDIGPYYFTLHVTVDNAATGHARKSLQALMDSAPMLVDKQDYYQRVINGYKLNQLGLGTNAIIDSFDLEQQLISILSAKSVLGQHMHSDFCRLDGLSVNEWLADASRIPQFLQSLQKNGWIKRHEDPQNSKFWKLLEGEQAEMFGVFNAYERQVIYDWIAGDALSKGAKPANGEADASALSASQHSYRVNRKLAERKLAQDSQAQNPAASEKRSAAWTNGDHRHVMDADVRRLEDKLAAMDNKEDIMRLLASLISPALHHTPVGLTATRLYKAMLDKYCHVRPHPLSVALVADTF